MNKNWITNSVLIMFAVLIGLLLWGYRWHLTLPLQVPYLIEKDLPNRLSIRTPYGPNAPRNVIERIFGFKEYSYRILSTKRVSDRTEPYFLYESICIHIKVTYNIIDSDNLREAIIGAYGELKEDFIYKAENNGKGWHITYLNDLYMCP